MNFYVFRAKMDFSSLQFWRPSHTLYHVIIIGSHAFVLALLTNHTQWMFNVNCCQRAAIKLSYKPFQFKIEQIFTNLITRIVEFGAYVMLT